MGHILGMPYQRFVNMPLHMIRLPMDYLMHL
jgi:predicted DNA binding CopG/RHH family protein